MGFERSSCHNKPVYVDIRIIDDPCWGKIPQRHTVCKFCNKPCDSEFDG